MHRQTYITRVRLPATSKRAYPITVRPGLLADAPRRIERLAAGGAVYLVSDTTVARLYGRRLRRACLELVPGCHLVEVRPGERSKRLAVYGALTGQLLKMGARRDSLIVALGGGVVGDLAGFVAATLLRGVALLQIPTTLLAQIDSSVGGKVGIDHAMGKNMLGAFHQPREVLIDPRLLRSLPRREFRNGLAELVKIALALDGALFSRMERAASRLTPRAETVLAELIAMAVALKAAVVMKDEFESGLRKTLNLGHTVGHAVEAASEYRIGHGEAVAIGLAVEARIALRLGLLEAGALRRLLGLLHALHLPVSVPRGMNRRRFTRSLALDKKFSGKRTAYVLPAGIGCAAIGVEVSNDLLREAIES